MYVCDLFFFPNRTWILSLNERTCLPLPSSRTLRTDCHLKIRFCDKLDLADPCQNSSVCQQSRLGMLNFGGYTEQPFNSQGTFFFPFFFFLLFFRLNFFQVIRDEVKRSQTEILYSLMNTVVYSGIRTFISIQRSMNYWSRKNIYILNNFR